MTHAPREHTAPQLLLLDRQPEPRTVPAVETATPAPAEVDEPEGGHQSRAFTAVIVVTALLAVLLLLAGSTAGAFVSGLVAVSVGLARYFHALATRPDQHD